MRSSECNPKEGSLLRVIRSGGIWCEPDVFSDKKRGRFAVYTSFGNEQEKARCRIPMHDFVLCLSYDEHPVFGFRVMRFFYNERTYTFRGYYLPKEYFEVATEKCL